VNVALRSARPADYEAIAAWIPDAEACLRWAGPRVAFPFSAAQLPHLLSVDGCASYCWSDGGSAACGFGQHWPHESGAVHLGRIIVSPALRGRGLGRELCRQLCARAIESAGASTVTLNVYRDNAVAVALYRSLGFAPIEARSSPEAFLMRMHAGTLRVAVAADIPSIQHVRHSVRENRLVSTVITDDDVRGAIDVTGRGWVVAFQGKIVAFAVGIAATGNIWALFVHPDHERRGYGQRLHDAMLGWLWDQGLERLWLTTEPETRAQGFYEAAGWQRVAATDRGELRYEFARAARPKTRG
jgi:[ribosomal protein S18]-alanine N-acetyltransferase